MTDIHILAGCILLIWGVALLTAYYVIPKWDRPYFIAAKYIGLYSVLWSSFWLFVWPMIKGYFI